MKKCSALTHIIVRNARENNLKNVDLCIPKNKFVVFCGLSGSGKSSMAFDILYREGQRKYIESLSSYARQFLGGLKKPKIDNIEGITPAISIDQKTISHNPRSTVGTITEIYDYLRLLFARVGKVYCPKCNVEIKKQSIDQIVENVLKHIESELSKNQIIKFILLAPIVKNRKGTFTSLFKNLLKQGYQEVRIDNKDIFKLSYDITLLKQNRHNIDIVLDKIIFSYKQFNNTEEYKTLKSRLYRTIDQSLKVSQGFTIFSIVKTKSFDFSKIDSFKDVLFSEKKVCPICGTSIKDFEPIDFSFNAPSGACPVCKGLGTIFKPDPNKIIASDISISQGAIIPLASTIEYENMQNLLLKEVVKELGYDIRTTPFKEYDKNAQHIILYGNNKTYFIPHPKKGPKFGKYLKFEGVLKRIEDSFYNTSSMMFSNELKRFMSKQVCPECQGQRLNKQSLSVFIDGLNIMEVSEMTVSEALSWIEKIKKTFKTNTEKQIAEPILKEIKNRLKFLVSVGLEYLTLSRRASTLSGGEAQRIRLSSQIGSGLTGVLYILDEPTIGLHQSDNEKLIKTLKNLKNQGNTVVVVEHDRDIIESSDFIVEFGPMAGDKGGSIVFSDKKENIYKANTITSQFLTYKKDIKRKRDLTEPKFFIELTSCNAHNLKNINVKFPLGKLICITGVSGSGKSTLLETLHYNLSQALNKKLKPIYKNIESIRFPNIVKSTKLIDQSPIGKTPRSNPATYTKTFDLIRQVFANTKDAKLKGFTVSHFSFNVKGGRCEACQGAGQIKIEMQFMPDVYITCEVCNGTRYNREVNSILYKGKSISDVLDMTIEEAYNFFDNAKIKSKLKNLIDVGLSYMKLGQSAPTLSGGEAQRVKLAKELSLNNDFHTVYLLDEPTTGLHFYDYNKLLKVLDTLIKKGNTVILIEHNLDIIKNADWIIDLGPKGGFLGGEIVASGTIEQIVKNDLSLTGKYLKQVLK